MPDDDPRAHRQPGRPRLSADEPSYQISTRLPEHVHDRLMTIANRSGRSVAEIVREMVVQRLK